MSYPYNEPVRPANNGLNFGLLTDEQFIDQNNPDKHLAGFTTRLIGETYPIIKPGGQWIDVWNKLQAEIQMGRKVETMGCTGFGTNNILEMIWLHRFNKIFNLSDRATNKFAGTTRSGNTVDAPIDATRKKGFLFEHEWAWDRDTFDWNAFYSVIPESLVKKAFERLTGWTFNHQYIPYGNKDAIMTALETSPLGCTVYAWAAYDGIYYDYGYRPNHFTTIIGFVKNKYWVIGDSYPTDFQIDNTKQQEYIKFLDWDYNFGCIKRYKINPLKPESVSIIAKFKNMVLKHLKMNFYKNANLPLPERDSPDNRANGDVYIVKTTGEFDENGNAVYVKKKVATLPDFLAAFEVALSEMDVYVDKTDWGELGQYQDTNRF